MTSLSELRFFASPPYPCSYLPERQATVLCVDPQAHIDRRLFSALSASGFRRSGSHVCLPWCDSCNACVPVRIPVDRFRSRRNHRRTWRYNADLTVREESSAPRDECHALYRRYIAARHADGDMYPPSPEMFASLLVDNRPETLLFTFRDADDRLLALSVADELDHGLSAVYTFFEPAMPRRSLGRFAILWLIDEARRRGLSHVYLGHWIKDCRKMSYKLDYRPCEILVNNRWTLQE